ncbi:ferric iron reductase protein FhuF [Modicisalibacter ilicicola DSM 19980]|uniref:Ferric iron reductase protein FhuF n=1 Tax=Modicisalibacter ilicicola DSM 19980 TaxID=1121942 RepID=A0A1M5CL11_9GAMM|nr:siderophore-iron reductase FhuF [Halomonas ilicicola]SHF55465.1 ferric iron reductase protein FhuF [Halomonas ilicicola DSM 19980]
MAQDNSQRESAKTLAQCYTGPFAAADPPAMTISPPSEAIPAAELLDPHALAQLLGRFGKGYAEQDIRGVASQWSKWYFAAVLVPALLADLLLRRELPLALERLFLLLTDDGRVERLCLGDTGRSLPGAVGGQRFIALLDDNLAPLIEALSMLSGASPRVFWSNAGNVFENILNQLEQHPDADPGATEPARHLLERSCLTDGRRNPLYRPVRYVTQPDGTTSRQRRLCCIRYLIPELDYCGNCPLTHRPARVCRSGR